MGILNIFGFPISMLVILIFSLMFLYARHDNHLARQIAYISGILLTVSAGFSVNLFVAAFSENADFFVPFTFAVTGIFAVILLVRALEIVKWKTALMLICITAALTASVVMLHSLF